MLMTLLGMNTLVRPEAPNARYPILTTLFGIVTLVSLTQSANAVTSIFVRPFPNVTCKNLADTGCGVGRAASSSKDNVWGFGEMAD